ncbi:scavenger receptor class B member 1-like isoform X5 [Zophobas morio]|uniref:scavenger receptor class B member 1-like isoform X5 n=1 Tax=Zophobas morio TaxID=2755281 RepID=UPI003083D741
MSRAFQTRHHEKTSSPLLIAFLGLMGIFGGIFALVIRPYDFLFKWKCVLSEGGEIFELWKSPPVDLYLRVYLWNVTNKEEFLSGRDDKLRVQDVGPYVYKELFVHSNVSFNDNGTINAVPRHPLVWVPELSEGRREDDLLILPNIALLSIAHVVSDESYFTRVGLNLLIRQTKTEALIQMTAKEFMFGYSSTLMTLGNKFMPSWITFDKLGLIDRMYDFEGDYETVYTGEDDVRKSGLLDTYRGSTKIPQWDNPCGNIRGASDGTKFPGFIQPNDTLLFFRKSMCRAKTLVKVGEQVINGLETYVYNFQEDADDNGVNNTANKCFCKDQNRCLPPGLLDVRGCYYGFPIALSYPHFYGGDPILNAKVIGSNPDPDKHKTYMAIQPTSGLPVDLAVRYQINMALGSIKTIANAERFNEMILPLLWTEIRLYSLPDMLAARFRLYLNTLPGVEQAITYFFFVMGAAFLATSVYKFLTSKTDRSYNTRWIEDDLVLNIEKKLSSYKPEKRASMTAKELEVYFSSLVTPLNQELCPDDEEA